ncbi:MAG: S41 family peptidase [Gemmatimonadota bacterium]|nr:S41 family peptidase [Gemmatimonadota bacterium]
MKVRFLFLFVVAFCFYFSALLPGQDGQKTSPVPPEPAPEGESRLLRYPDIHNDLVVFVHAGDLWTVPASGGRASRLTASSALELSPHFSPDGRWIAFTGEYDGNRDVYVIPAEGGAPRRLTWRQAGYGELRHGYDNFVLDWTPDGGKVLFRSWRRSFDRWFMRLFTVAADGSRVPEVLDLPEGGLSAFSPDGKKLAYNRSFRNFRTWKRYYGGLAQDIWLWDFEAKKSRRLTDWKGTDTNPLWLGDKIFYNSDESGKFNLYELDLSTGARHTVTFHSKWDVRWPGGGPGGIVYQCGGYLYRLDPATGASIRIPVTVGDDCLSRRPAWEDVSKLIRTYNLSATGKRAVFEARGDIFTLPAEHGEIRQITSTSGIHERSPVWSPDGKWICLISDETGEEELYLVKPGPLNGAPREKLRLTTDGHCHRFTPVWSPDSKRIAFADKDLKLWLLEVASKKLTLVDTTRLWEITHYSFSPCGRWLAFSKAVQRDKQFYSIFLYDVDSKNVHRITDGRTNDRFPVFDPGGKYLYFASGRDFAPKLGNFEFSYLYEKMDRLYLLTLQADTLSPLAPRSDEETAGDKEEDKKSAEKDVKGKDKKKVKSKAPAKTVIDLEGLAGRVVALSEKPGNCHGLRAVEGKIFWLDTPWQGKSTLHRYDLAKRKQAKLADEIDGYDISPDGKKLIVKKGNAFVVADAGTSKIDFAKGKLKVSGLRARVDYPAEWRQMFYETWRQQRDFFYDENMHEVDWDAERNRYAALLPHLAHRDDLNYILGEFVSELAAGHTYVGRGDYPKHERVESGLLGCELNPSNGFWRISRILPGENWTSGVRSPLTGPGMNVKTGDYLLAVDGQPLTTPANPYRLLEGKRAGSTVALTIGKTPDIEKARTVRARPVRDEQPLRYLEWVECNLRKVLDATGGRAGYLHIPNMGLDGLSEFVKRFYAQLDREALIIDVRYNGGGFVSQMILERLSRRTIGMDAPRNAAAEPYPMASFDGPMACIINQYSASDGDIFPYFFRKKGLGPLIGRRTWGGVVGIRGYSTLIDGGYITRPEFGTFSADSRWIMENKGVSPDIEVDNPPEDVIAGRDPQLERAIEEIMRKLAEKPTKMPAKPEPPGKR